MSNVFSFSPSGNWWEVPSLNAAQWRVDWFVYPTWPCTQNLWAPCKGAAEDPLPGIRRPLKSWFTWQTDRQYTALTWTCMQCPLPSGPCHPPSYTEYRGWVWGKAAVELTFTVSMTRNWKTVILPLIMVFGFHFTHVAIRLHCQGNRPLCSEYALKWRTSNLSARVKDG